MGIPTPRPIVLVIEESLTVSGTERRIWPEAPCRDKLILLSATVIAVVDEEEIMDTVPLFVLPVPADNITLPPSAADDDPPLIDTEAPVEEEYPGDISTPPLLPADPVPKDRIPDELPEVVAEPVPMLTAPVGEEFDAAL